MRKAGTITRRALAIATVPLLAGCVEPAYVAPGPIQLQPYPPPVTYLSVPDDRPASGSPIPLQPAPLVEPLPPPPTAPTVTELPADDLGGAIPVQDMPPLATDAGPSANDPASAPPAQIVRKAPTSGAGSNVPLEGFRPMHGQTRVTP